MLAGEFVKSSRHLLTSLNIFGNLRLVLQKTNLDESQIDITAADYDAFFVSADANVRREALLFLTVVAAMSLSYEDDIFSPNVKKVNRITKNLSSKRVTVNTLQTPGVCTSSHATLEKS